MLASDRDYIIPIRLDDAWIEGLPKTIGYHFLTEAKIETVASLIAEKVGRSEVITTSRPSTADERRPATQAVLPQEGFIRRGITRAVRVTDSEMLASVTSLEQGSHPRARRLVSRDLQRFLSFKHEVYGGPAYSVWKDGARVFLSLLPGILNFGHVTYEFELYGRGRMAMVAEWRSENASWAPVGVDEFHTTVGGLIADRSGCDLGREATIRVLERRGVSFSFPVGPIAGPPEKECEWIDGAPTDVLVNWDLNPRLADAGLGPWQPLFHMTTGEAILYFIVQGLWSNAALYAFEDALDVLLPDRYLRLPRDSGRMDVVIHLGRAQTEPGDPIRAVELGLVRRSEALVHAALTRMVAAHRDWPQTSPAPTAGLPPLEPGLRGLLNEAIADVGDQSWVTPVRDWPGDPDETSWVKLRHCDQIREFGLSWEDDLAPYSFASVVTPNELRAILQRCET